MILEVATESFLESKIAKQNGATRIELCENLSMSGTTPSYGTVKACIDYLQLPISVMIRPRGGNFVYDALEIEIMKNDILLLKTLNVDSFVFGVLLENNTINYVAMSQLIKASGNTNITIHRAFDYIEYPRCEIKKLANIGVNRILTAGGNGTAFEGVSNIKQTIIEANKFKIQTVVAGKITKNNLSDVIKMLPAQAYHGRNIVCDFNK